MELIQAHRSLLVDPSVELANVDVGHVFRRRNDNKLYMVINHGAIYTEIARIYWWDLWIANVLDFVVMLVESFGQAIQEFFYKLERLETRQERHERQEQERT